MTDNNEPLSQLLTCKSKVIPPQDRARRVKTDDIGKSAQLVRGSQKAIDKYSFLKKSNSKKKCIPLANRENNR